jgi:ABC-type polysaccharide/polyol phosphate transport system ATPase subunit
VIVLERVTKIIGSGQARKVILSNVSATIPTHLRIALLAPSKAERIAFLEVLGNLAPTDRGHVYHDARVSFSVGRLDGFANSLSSRVNTAYLARLYGQDVTSVIKRLEKYSQFSDRLDLPFAQLNKNEKILLAYFVAFSLAFDFYILPAFPALLGRDPGLAKLFKRRMKKSGMVVPLNREAARRFCDFVIILFGGRLFPFANVDEGFDSFHEIMAENRAEKSRDE